VEGLEREIHRDVVVDEKPTTYPHDDTTTDKTDKPTWWLPPEHLFDLGPRARRDYLRRLQIWEDKRQRIERNKDRRRKKFEYDNFIPKEHWAIGDCRTGPSMQRPPLGTHALALTSPSPSSSLPSLLSPRIPTTLSNDAARAITSWTIGKSKEQRFVGVRRKYKPPSPRHDTRRDELEILAMSTSLPCDNVTAALTDAFLDRDAFKAHNDSSTRHFSSPPPPSAPPLHSSTSSIVRVSGLHHVTPMDGDLHQAIDVMTSLLHTLRPMGIVPDNIRAIDDRHSIRGYIELAQWSHGVQVVTHLSSLVHRHNWPFHVELSSVEELDSARAEAVMDTSRSLNALDGESEGEPHGPQPNGDVGDTGTLLKSLTHTTNQLRSPNNLTWSKVYHTHGQVKARMRPESGRRR